MLIFQQMICTAIARKVTRQCYTDNETSFKSSELVLIGQADYSVPYFFFYSWAVRFYRPRTCCELITMRLRLSPKCPTC